ncbi:hypothetical protein RHSIM_Rhsim02G0242400 [Rhododendron simsii]|uniref:F-box domain-containing protein n=1 Tax=Rhododendron simsii TaxID=118357 RepID=A0A834LSM2_RHOSS|nr:hypothetical protein RHSIM_Rhsim02G0242400 [Rhododendron simsii]
MKVLKQSQQNNFDHLPDNIVLLILNKLWEAKWICRCLIVSKRFASLISHINNVSVKSPHYVSTWLEQETGSTSVFDYLVGLKDIVYLHLEERFFGELHPTNIAVVCFDDACMRLNIVMDMIKKHQMLQSITISDIKNRGKIVVSGNQISGLRDLERAKLLMPEVDSGRAELLLNSDVNDDDMLAGSFDGEEGEAFNEAVKEILAKHKSKLNTVAAAAQN